MNITDFCIFVPSIHGIDSFRQLSATAFVNAAGIDPAMHYTGLFRNFTCHEDFLVASHGGIAGFNIVPVSYLLIAPGVRKNCICGDRCADELFELPSTCVDETHVACRGRRFEERGKKACQYLSLTGRVAEDACRLTQPGHASSDRQDASFLMSGPWMIPR